MNRQQANSLIKGIKKIVKNNSNSTSLSYINEIKNNPSLNNYNLVLDENNQYKLINTTLPNQEQYGLTSKIIEEYTVKLEKIKRQLSFINYFISGLSLIPVGYFSVIILKNETSTIGDIILILIISEIFAGSIICQLIFELCKYITNKLTLKRQNAGIYYNINKYRNDLLKYNSTLEANIKEYEQAKYSYQYYLKKQKIEYWKSLSGRQFEIEMTNLFNKNGYKAELTQASNDKGIDIILYKDNEKIIVQCKQHAKPVGPHVVRDLYGTMIASKANRAILVCTSGYTSGVWEYVKGKKIHLMKMEEILDLANNIDMF